MVEVSLESERSHYGKAFPLKLRPETTMNFVQLQEYMMQTAVLEKASEHGAVLFEGFDVRSAEEFAAVLLKCGIKAMEYVGGAAVRRLIVGREGGTGLQIVTTNESPPSEPIPFHHELAQTPSMPDHICFFCVESFVDKGGATPLCRSDAVLDEIRRSYPDFVAALEQGVKYVKVTPAVDDASSALGRSWKSMYGVETKEEAEKAMLDKGWTWEWLEGDDCRITSPVLPAIRVASNGRRAFCNQIVAAYTGWIDSRNEPSKAVVFADGAPMPEDAMKAVVGLMQDMQFAHPWKKGDFVIVDNSVTCHSRQPFSGGPRKVVAAIGRGKSDTAGIPHFVLSSGDVMPSVGLGCWKLGNAEEVVYRAIRDGYRLIDSAADYGNEEATGKAIKRAIDEGICTRSELFVVSKLWNSFHGRVDVGLDKTLKDLQLNYVDLYLIHFPIAQKFVPVETRYPPEWFYDPSASHPRMEFDADTTYQDTWRGMEALVDNGKARNIGCCNVGTTHLRQVFAYARIKPTVLQVEMHPYNSQKGLLRFAREHGLQTMAFSNLGPLSYVELGGATMDMSLLKHTTILGIAQDVGKSPAAVVLRWGVQRGTIIIPKTANFERLKANLALFDFALTDDHMAAIDGLNKNQRFNDPGVFCELAFNTYCPIYE